MPRHHAWAPFGALNGQNPPGLRRTRPLNPNHRFSRHVSGASLRPGNTRRVLSRCAAIALCSCCHALRRRSSTRSERTVLAPPVSTSKLVGFWTLFARAAVIHHTLPRRAFSSPKPTPPSSPGPRRTSVPMSPRRAGAPRPPPRTRSALSTCAWPGPDA